MKKRRGNIKIHRPLIDNPDHYKLFLFKLFSVFIPVFIEHKFEYITYSGYSDEFDEIDEGLEIPFYLVNFIDEGSSISMEITRI